MSSGGFAPRAAGPSMDATLTRDLIQALRDSRRGAREDWRDRPQPKPKPPKDDPKDDPRDDQPQPPEKPPRRRDNRGLPMIKDRDDDGGVVGVLPLSYADRRAAASARAGGYVKLDEPTDTRKKQPPPPPFKRYMEPHPFLNKMAPKILNPSGTAKCKMQSLILTKNIHSTFSSSKM